MIEWVPLKRVARLSYGSALPADGRLEGEIPVIGSGGISGYHNKANVLSPGIIVGRKGSYGSVKWSPVESFVIDTAYFLDHRSTRAHMRWLYYALKAVDLKRSSQDVGVPGLSREVAHEVHIPWMEDFQEQKRIARFLDAQIGIVNEAQRLISEQMARVSERRAAVLDSLRLGSAVRSMVRLGYRASLVTSGSRGWASFVGESGNVFFRSANLVRDSICPNLENIAFVDLPGSENAEYFRSRILPGDVLVGITGANAGWVSLADGSVSGGNVSQHVCLVRPVPSLVDGKWLAYLISSPVVQGFLMGSQYGGTKTQLSLPDIRNIRIPSMSLEEQRKSVIRVEEAVLEGEAQLRLRKQQIEVLEERKRALITAAVTGQIDVTTARGADVS